MRSYSMVVQLPLASCRAFFLLFYFCPPIVLLSFPPRYNVFGTLKDLPVFTGKWKYRCNISSTFRIKNQKWHGRCFFQLSLFLFCFPVDGFIPGQKTASVSYFSDKSHLKRFSLFHCQEGKFEQKARFTIKKICEAKSFPIETKGDAPK